MKKICPTCNKETDDELVTDNYICSLPICKDCYEKHAIPYIEYIKLYRE